MNAHTPGPWYWDAKVWDYDKAQDAPWLVKNEIATVLTGQINCESEANARLIAAAPELLEACNLFVEYEQTAEDDGMAMMFAYNALRVAVHAAIAKATGVSA